MSYTIENSTILNISTFKSLGTLWNKKDYSFEAEGFSFDCHFETEDKYFTIEFSRFDKQQKQSVKIISKPSNLGKGQIHYFVCPVSGHLCRKLYLHEQSNGFASFKGYKEKGYPLVYVYQTLSKRDRLYNLQKNFNQKYIELLRSKRKSEVYNGKVTKTAQRLLKYSLKETRYDEMILKDMLKFIERLEGNVFE